MHNGLGAPNGPRTAAFDRWFRYPAGFGRDTLDACFAAIDARRGALVVDPFAGVSTAGITACARGFTFVGIEAHPLIAELAALKFVRQSDPAGLLRRACALVDEAPLGDTTAEHPLIARSFIPDTLEQLVGLRERIQAFTDDPWGRHLKWCLLGALRECAAVKVGWPYQRPGVARVPRLAAPLRAFARRAAWMAEDLNGAPITPTASIYPGDARAAETWCAALEGRRAEAVVTSPPYLNNFDYADATRLELYFWGVARSWNEMIAQVRDGMVIASTQQTRRAIAWAAADTFAAACPRTARTVADLTACLASERAARPRGKEYDQLLPSYFADLVRVLTHIREHTTAGAPVALVLGDSAPYGVHVDTPALLAAAAQEIGFTCIAVRPLRCRGSRWRANGVRHAVALTEQLVLLHAPSGS